MPASFLIFVLARTSHFVALFASISGTAMANYHGPGGSTSISSQGDRTSVSNALLTHTSTSTEAREHRTRQIFKEIQGVQSRRIARRPRSRWGLINSDTIPPLPPQFKRRLDEDEVMPYGVRLYHQKITRGDYGLGPGGLGLRSPVIELLQKDAMDRYHGGIPRLRWNSIKKIANKIDIWELSSVDSDEVCEDIQHLTQGEANQF